MKDLYRHIYLDSDCQPLYDISHKYWQPEYHRLWYSTRPDIPLPESDITVSESEFYHLTQITNPECQYNINVKRKWFRGNSEIMDTQGVTYSTTKLYFRDLPEDYRNLDIFSELSHIFRNTRDHCDPDFLYESAFYLRFLGGIPAHCDVMPVAFNLAISGTEQGLDFYNTDCDTPQTHDVITTLHYEAPAILLNAYQPHGSVSSQTERIVIAVRDFTESWEEINTMVN
jgi:hypothetical protein